MVAVAQATTTMRASPPNPPNEASPPAPPNPPRRAVNSTRTDAAPNTPRSKCPRRNCWVDGRNFERVQSVSIRITMTWRTMHPCRLALPGGVLPRFVRRGVLVPGRVRRVSNRMGRARVDARLIGTEHCRLILRGIATPILRCGWRRRRHWAAGRYCTISAPIVLTMLAPMPGPPAPDAPAAVASPPKAARDATTTIPALTPPRTNPANHPAALAKRKSASRTCDTRMRTIRKDDTLAM
mmetsp:Transcript_26512/g.56965  ORF Transcript_26512/g.56965 Transcript_26512/m.56965 type:complete len:239 (-) Transcript_26512:926-1642(-)